MKNFRLLSLYVLLIVSLSLPTTPVSADSPKRIISLAPNITEILFAMGLGDSITGVTSFCDYPEQAKKKPKVGGMSNPSLEAVVSLKPDIVVMTTDGNSKEFEERLRSLQVKTYVFRARKLAELPQGIRDMGSALGVTERAYALAKEIETAINTYKVKSQPFSATRRGEESEVMSRNSKVKDSSLSLKKKVLFIVWPEPLIVAGPGTEIDDVISLLGYKNIASTAKTSYPKYSIEEIIQQSPDVIFIGKGHTDMKEMSQGLLRKIGSVPAVKNGSVFFLSDSLYRLGPRVIKGIREMAACLR